MKVRPSKVVAGHEADRTNEFLQILGISILKEVGNHTLNVLVSLSILQLDSSEAIKKVLKGEKPSDTLLKDKKKRSMYIMQLNLRMWYRNLCEAARGVVRGNSYICTYIAYIHCLIPMQG